MTEEFKLKYALMGMVSQHFHRPDASKVEICHSFMSADEDAIAALIELGLAEEVSSKPLRFRLLWGELEKQRSWSKNRNETPEEIYNSEWGKRIRAESEARQAAKYTGICPGCGQERYDLCSLDDPPLCGDCGLRQMVLNHGGVVIEKTPEPEGCSSCQGSGLFAKADRDSPQIKCDECNGRGTI
jgi:hypothetical protein